MNIDNQSTMTVYCTEEIPKGRIVHLAGTLTDGIPNVALATGPTQGSGVLTAAHPSGERAEMVVAGEAEVECGDGAITHNGDVMADANARADVYASGAGSNVRIGKALQAGIAPSGSKYGYIRVLLAFDKVNV